MKPMLSKAWSCSTLGHGLDAVDAHYQELCENPLTEADMKAELAHLEVFRPIKHYNNIILVTIFFGPCQHLVTTRSL